MQHYLDAAGYGNRKVGSQVDLFWLDGTLRISADEQVEFLKQLYRDDLPFSKRSLETVRQIMLIEEDELHRLRVRPAPVSRETSTSDGSWATRKEMGMCTSLLSILRAQARRPVAAKPGRSLCRSCRIHSVLC